MRIALATLILAYPLLAVETSTNQPAAADSVLKSNGTKSYQLEDLDEGADTSAASDAKPAPAKAPVKKIQQTIAVQNSTLEKLTLGGNLQFKAYYHDMTANRDADKDLTFSLDRFLVDLKGTFNENFGMQGQFLLESNGRRLGTQGVFGYYQQGHFKLKAGKIKKPFSMEALQKSEALYTVDRGRLYQTFLSETTGYSAYDVGLILKGGFEDAGMEVSYEAGVFNGKQSNTGYSGAHYEAVDEGFKAKDVAGRVALKGFHGFEAELAFSTKTAESATDAKNLDFAANAAYVAGAAYEIKGLRFQGEMAWGANHNGRDSLIVAGSSEFLAFYGMLLWHRDYSGGRASETLVKIEGLDPDMTIGEGGGKPNDGKFRYTAGVNYFFSPKVSLLLNYGLLHPITEARKEGHLVQDIDLAWRLNF